MSENEYDQTLANQAINKLRNPPVRMLVTQQITELEKEIKARKELLLALDNAPGVEDILDKMRKLHI